MRALLLALLVAACGSPASSQPATTPDDVTAPSAEPGAIADALLGEAPAAAWSPTEQRALYQVTYREEGTGAGLSIAVAGAGTDGETIEVYTPGQDEAAAKTEARKKLVERVTGKGFVLMAYTAWPDEAPSITLPGGPELTWKGSSLWAGGAELTSIPPEDPHHAHPSGVFSLPGSSTIVFLYAMDPGEAYVEGFNAFTGARVLVLSSRP